MINLEVGKKYINRHSEIFEPLQSEAQNVCDDIVECIKLTGTYETEE